MNASLHQKFTDGIRWNAIEALPYQLLLSLHNMALFGCMSARDYGLIGTIFSLIFLAIGIANLGFDTALPGFCADAQSSKAQYKKIIGVQYAPTCAAMLIAAFIVPLLLKNSLSNYELILIAALIIIEGLKKGIRGLLHGAFYNKKTAIIELFQIVTYVTLMWTCYAIGLSVDIQSIFGILLIVSTVCVLILGYHLYDFYSTLPNEALSVSLKKQTTNKVPFSNMVQQRFYATLTSISHQFFSGNALVPLFAYRFGLSAAGTLKLICSIAYGATICIQKIFGSTTDALFAQVKYQELSDKQQAFFLVTKNLYAALYGVLLFGSSSIIWLYTTDTVALGNTGIIPLLLFFVIHVSEQFFITYERFFITENRAGVLMIFNGITLACLYGIFCCIPIHHPIMLLQAVLCVRIISFILISGVAFIWWRIRPRMSIDPMYLVYSLALSLLCLFIVR